MLSRRLQPARRAARANLLPGLLLQAFAFVIVLGYFGLPWVVEALGAVGRLKDRGGFLFSALSTGIFGGLIPFGVMLWGGRIPQQRRWSELTFYLLFWAYKGLEVDAFYRLQAGLFGAEATAPAIAAKVSFDQFVYNPLWAAPTQTIAFMWKDTGFSWPKVQALLVQQSLMERSLVILLSTWVVWIPAVAMIYSLPSPLQLPLFNLVLCFWCLLLSFVSRGST